MKLTFANKFENWLDPFLDAIWFNTPRIIGGVVMMIGIAIELFVYLIQTIAVLFVPPDNKEAKKEKNPLSANLLDDE